MNQKLQVYADKLEKNKVKTIYKQDPFAQFLAGMIQEAMNENNDAFRSYEDALNGYEQIKKAMNIPTPDLLKAAVFRSALSLGYTEAIDKYKAKFGSLPGSNPADWAGKARVIVISSFGQVAHKESAKWTVVDPQGDVISMAYPVFKKGCSAISSVNAEVAGVKEPFEVADDVSMLAINVLDDKNAQIKGRAMAKAIIRYAAAKATKVAAKNTSGWASLGLAAANIAVNATSALDQADTRSWMTLPDEYWISVFPVEPGEKKIKLDYMGFGHVVNSHDFIIKAEAGKTYFIVDKSREPVSAFCK